MNCMKSQRKLLFVFGLIMFSMIYIQPVFAQCFTWGWASNTDSPGYSTNWEFAKDIAKDNSNNLIVVGEFNGSEIVFGSTTLQNLSQYTYEIFVVKYDDDGNVLWAKSAEGNQDDFVTSVVTDQSGDIIITGYFASPSLTFGSTILNNTGNKDVFIVKYNGANGDVLWAKSAVGSGDDYSMDLAIDNSDNVYLTGYFDQDEDIEFGSILLTKPCYNSGMFLVKYNSAGNEQWGQCAEEGYWGGAKGYSLTIDHESNIYVTGTYQWESISFGTTTLSYDIMNGEQMYLVKYDSDGTPIWAKKSTGVNNYGGIANAPREITADAFGNVYITGYFDVDEMSFGTVSLSSSTAPAADIFLVKFNSAGNPLWIKGGIASNTMNNYGKSVYTDSEGGVYLTGNFSTETIDLGGVELINSSTNSTADIFIAKYDNDGNLKWGEAYGNSKDDEVSSILIDNINNIYLAGSFRSSTLNLDAVTITNTGSTDNYDMLAGRLVNSIVPTFDVSDVLCYGGNDGSIDLSLAGGTSPYGCNWSSGQTSVDISSLAAGTYIVTITDNNECIKIDSAIVIQPAELISDVLSVTDVTCYGGNDGAINLDVSGGTSPYDYEWSNDCVNQDPTDIFAGNYLVTISDSHGCIIYDNAVVYEPDDIALSELEILHVSCFGYSDGEISFEIVGGTSPYSCEWSNGATSQDITGLIADTYTVTITDANNCLKVESLTVNQPDILTSDISSEDVLCYGGSSGSIILVPDGGTFPYEFQWSNGDNVQNPEDLPIGVYNVTITDSHSCSTTNSIEIFQPEELVSEITSTVDNVCFGASDGSIDLSVSGGTVPYEYEWSNSSEEEDLIDITAGEYQVTITDSHNCTTYNTAIINQPNQIELSYVDITHISCYNDSDGAIDIEISGGAEPYECEWSNGAITQDLNSLSAGIYELTITDNENCIKIESLEVTQPDLLESSINVNDVMCYGGNDGSVDLFVTGGTLPYTYIWSNGAEIEDVSGLIADNYSVTVVDSHACAIYDYVEITQPEELLTTINVINNVSCFGGNDAAIDLVVEGGTNPYYYQWSNGTEDEDINELVEGVYDVTVTDSHLCTTTNMVEISQPDEIEMSFTVLDVLCYGGNDGAIDVEITGGVEPYEYLWSNSEITEDLSGLVSGTYTLTVYDDNDCLKVWDIIVNEPEQLQIEFSNNNICYGETHGEIDLTVIGGVQPYTYLWSGGEITEDIASLDAGTYTVTVTDANLCTISDFTDIAQADSPLDIQEIVNDVLCYGGNTGSIILNVSGSVAPYLYEWSNSSDTPEIYDLLSGTYTVTVTDDIGCTLSSSIFIDEPEALDINYTTINPECNGYSTGSIDISVTGGVSPYSYYWSNGDSEEDVEDLVAGIYSAFVVDSNNCVIYANAELQEPEPINAQFQIANTCYGVSGGEIEMEVNGGTAPYTYLWDNDEVTQNIQELMAGTYFVTITDFNMCQNVMSAVVEETDSDISVDYSVTDVLCYGQNTGEIQLSVSGGEAPYYFEWNDGQNTQNVSGLLAGDYSVTVHDDFGCYSETMLTIDEQEMLTIDVNVIIDSAGNCLGQLEAIVEGGVSPYSYNWYDPQMQTGIIADSLCGGHYMIVVHDDNNCSISDIAFVETGTAFVFQENSDLNIDVFPNPADDIIYIDLFNKKDYMFKLVNITGQIVVESLLKDGLNTIDVKKINQKGLYLVQIYDQNGQLVSVRKQIIR